MIKIENLTKSFNGVKVLDGINIEIKKGLIYGLVGKSGAGKSTLLRCINGLEKYDSGLVNVNGIDLNTLNEKEERNFRKNIGMIFQNFALLSRLSIYDNVALPLKLWNYPKNEIHTRVHELLTLVGIEDKANNYPAQLSGGQKQRVAIARALSLKPEILLCDEATSALDPKTGKSIMDLLRTINTETGITIVIVTHKMSDIRNICDEVAILEDGIVATNGKVSDIFIEKPKALKNLIGQQELIVPNEGVTLRILVNHGENNVATIQQLCKSDIDFKLLGGDVAIYRENSIGSIYVNIESFHEALFTQHLTEQGILWSKVEEEI